MWKIFFTLLLLCTAQFGFCQPQQFHFQQKPLPTPQPTQNSVVPSASASVVNEDERIANLRQAAAHLQAAGLNDEADKILRMTKTDKNPLVVVNLSVVEVSLSKLDKLGLTLEKLISGDSPDSAAAVRKTSTKDDLFGSPAVQKGTFAMLKEDDRYFSVLKALTKDQVVTVLAAPTIVTESGREACFHSGGQIVPVSAKNSVAEADMKKFTELAEKLDNQGIDINVNPIFVDNQTVRLEVKGSISELDKKHSAKVAGSTVPGIRKRDFCTTITIKNGYVFVMSGLVQQRHADNAPADASNADKTQEIALLVLIKAETYESKSQIAAKPPAPLLK